MTPEAYPGAIRKKTKYTFSEGYKKDEEETIGDTWLFSFELINTKDISFRIPFTSMCVLIKQR
jgi:hypothetical protein